MTENDLPIREIEERPIYPEDGFINSRRFGPGSLGINLARGGHYRVVCNYRCEYCQYEVDARRHSMSLTMKKPDRGFILSGPEYIDYVIKMFEKKLNDSEDRITAITFSGNCESTLNPYFSEIAKRIMGIRDSHSSEKIRETPINIFTNGSTLGQSEVARALEMYFDKICIKLDAPDLNGFERINHPLDKDTSLYRIAGNAGALIPSHGKKIAQTMVYRNDDILNLPMESLCEYETLLRTIDPEEIHLYTLRYQPPKNIKRASEEDLNSIRDALIKINNRWEGRISCYSELVPNNMKRRKKSLYSERHNKFESVVY